MSNRHAKAKSMTFDFLSNEDNRDELVDNETEKEFGKSLSFIYRNSEITDHVRNQSIDNMDGEGDGESGDVESYQQVDQLSDDVDKFIVSLKSDSKTKSGIVFSKLMKYLKNLDVEIDGYEAEDNYPSFGLNPNRDWDTIGSVNRVSALHVALQKSRSNNATMPILNETSAVHNRVMVFLETELRILLEEPMYRNSGGSSSKHWDSSLRNLKGRIQSFAVHQDHATGAGEVSTLPEKKSDAKEKKSDKKSDAKKSDVADAATKSDAKEDGNDGIPFPSFSPECQKAVGMIANAMVSGGYESECCNVFAVSRRLGFEEELRKLGFDKVSVDDVQKMNWETLEGEIVTWIRVFKHCCSELFPFEQQFYKLIFPKNPKICEFLIGEIAFGVLSILVNFAEAVSVTKRTTEKLFKFLDLYEILKDSIPVIEDNRVVGLPKDRVDELRAKLSFVQLVIGEVAVSVFCQLENSIKADGNKSAVPNGAVHPLTRYTMNYVKYACEYKDSLEEAFQRNYALEQWREQQQQQSNPNNVNTAKNDDPKASGRWDDEERSPFTSQLISVTELLDQSLETKSKLYKDTSLQYIFLMNNGRYMLQKVRESKEVNEVLGNNWIRKRSSDVRNYHKSYQRESWSKVLQCLNHEGLQVNGKVYKPYLKDRFKSFNQMFDEINKTQSTWVVSDEQLQSELRVSISSVIIPAYRSFVAKFGPIFTPGRQVGKYIKYQPDDVEAVIEGLFDGSATSMSKKGK